ncbi:MAG: SDR family NAD(P)-dependent oxidoreductase [Solirubrobacteraceae bacterium]
MERLEGRVAVVTGAASGIGRGLADRFAAEGMKVVLADVEPLALDVAVEELRATGAQVLGVRTDVSRIEDVETLAACTLDAFGAVHVLCNNAGVDTGAPFAEISLPMWHWILGVNLWGAVHGCRVFLPLLRQQDEGHIVNVSSTVTSIGYMPTGGAYVTSKFAINGLTETLFRELDEAGDSVGVSLLIPGPVDTRIPDSERNLPATVPGLAGNRARLALVETLRAGGSDGLMAPSEVADHVVRGIRERRFYILTHPDAATDAIEARLEWMRSNERPPPNPALEPWVAHPNTGER